MQSNRLRKHIWLGSIALAATMLFVSFQNFERPLQLAMLKPEMKSAYAREKSVYDGSGDIRDIAPPTPHQKTQPSIATPESGHDLNSVSQDWLMRQTHALTGGAEEKILADVNKKMNRMMKFEPVEGEPYPDGTTRDPASVDSSDAGNEGRESETQYMGLMPTSVQLTALNRLQMNLSNRANVSCSIQGEGIQWDLARPINNRVDLNLRHIPSSNSSSLRLHYNW